MSWRTGRVRATGYRTTQEVQKLFEHKTRDPSVPVSIRAPSEPEQHRQPVPAGVPRIPPERPCPVVAISLLRMGWAGKADNLQYCILGAIS